MIIYLFLNLMYSAGNENVVVLFFLSTHFLFPSSLSLFNSLSAFHMYIRQQNNVKKVVELLSRCFMHDALIF